MNDYEPSPEAVEAAAKAVHEWFVTSRNLARPWTMVGQIQKDEYRDLTRTSIKAAMSIELAKARAEWEKPLRELAEEMRREGCVSGTAPNPWADACDRYYERITALLDALPSDEQAAPSRSTPDLLDTMLGATMPAHHAAVYRADFDALPSEGAGS